MKDKNFSNEEVNAAGEKARQYQETHNVEKITKSPQGRNKLEQFEIYEPEWETLDKVKAKTQPWFWPGIIPRDTITLFGGYGGIGKSLILLYLAAKTTTGESFKAGGLEHKFPKGSVILLSAEDEKEYQIKPKLVAMNADLNKIHYHKSKIGQRSNNKKFIELDKDLHVIEQKIKEIGDVKLIIIDPIVYFLGDVRDHINPEVANFLQSLIDLSKKYQIATVLNKHLRKQATGSKGAQAAADEVGGAGAWTNTPRRCWLITNWHEDINVKVITKMKDNLGKSEDEAFAYRIHSTSIIEDNVSVETTHLVWLDHMISITADEAVSEEHYEKSKHKKSIDFIHAYLKKNGQSLVKSIREKAIAQQLCSDRTFKEAEREFETIFKDNLKIERGIKNQKMYMLIEEA